MTRTIMRKKVLLPALLLVAVVALATVAGAAQGPTFKPPKAQGDTPAVMQAIREGKAKKLHLPPERATRTVAFWTGCQFVYVPAGNSEYQFDDGSVASVGEEPRFPPRNPACGDRNPTEAEFDAMYAELNDRNWRPPGLPAPPNPRTAR